MKAIPTTLKTLKTLAPMLNYNQSTTYAVMTLKDGSKMTTTLNIFDTPENHVVVNISNAKTFDFETREEFNKWLSSKFETFESDKDMYQSFIDMDDETWEEWNK